MTFEFHPEAIFVLPLLAVQHGECADAHCGAEHWLLEVGWLCFSAQIVFPF